MGSNKVKVKIYGQEYVISGDKTHEHIIKVAEYVDLKIREIEKHVSVGQGSLVAVLAAVNVADEYFSMIDDISELKKTKEKLEKDVEHYLQMWEEAKRSFVQYKEDAQAVSRNKETLKNLLGEKEQEVIDLKILLDEAEIKAQKNADGEIKKLQEQLKEIEDNYFDLQMENVQLKSEIERLKR